MDYILVFCYRVIICLSLSCVNGFYIFMVEDDSWLSFLGIILFGYYGSIRLCVRVISSCFMDDGRYIFRIC